ncbi:hypothetical protein GUITHDRAFT_120412 [Guillardia theta CCMP2712]|uniref:EF-hand domain-containing protein n=1 Tax=Guillardia theta (strain CCMP2712) TaxID=905079 RepID=L1IB11_GUITC|nr:hypothetical protein GUITHDRAFT_120412 [Guillardia theta CCMP2712]EKX33408.1 hypothetical protein GUITHDRAFT_120412 [Guillardia theta CCMP2712]|eukprot:XP_005820388.1 hypothetical protein GUITHDRAFT_120412 [Guillardia theta CCMP2712]
MARLSLVFNESERSDGLRSVLRDAIQTTFHDLDIQQNGFLQFKFFSQLLHKSGLYINEMETNAIKRHLSHIKGAEDEETKIVFTIEDIHYFCTNPSFMICLQIEESMSSEREIRPHRINQYVSKVLEQDEKTIDDFLKSPSLSIVGDRQAVLRLAKILREKSLDIATRKNLTKAISKISEKPREASGVDRMPGVKKDKIYDDQAIAAFSWILCHGSPIYMDQRTFTNPEHENISQDLIPLYTHWIQKYEKSTRRLEFVTKLQEEGSSRQSVPPELVEYRETCHEACEFVRMEAIRGLGNISDHEHEHSLKVIWRFEALFVMYRYVPPGSGKMLKAFAVNIRKASFFERWDMQEYWWSDQDEPWRSQDESRKYLWQTLEISTRDIAWQVRVRAIEVITETAEIGNIDAHRILVPLIEDQSNVRSPNSVTMSFELDAKRVKSATQRGLTNLLYGRGEWVARRWEELQKNVKDGMEHDLAASEAEEKATRATRKDAATTVIDVLIEYIKSGKHGFRQQNLITLGKVVHSATMRGENKCINFLVDCMDSDIASVRTSAMAAPMMSTFIANDMRSNLSRSSPREGSETLSTYSAISLVMVKQKFANPP